MLEAAYEKAGFHDIRTRTVPAPLRLASASACVRFERESFGALHQMMSGMNEAEREETWREIERGLAPFESAAGFEGPCELVVGAAAK